MKHLFIIPVATALLFGCAGSEAPTSEVEADSASISSTKTGTSTHGNSQHSLKLEDLFPRDRLVEVDIKV